jgi:Rrf2 family protein
MPERFLLQVLRNLVNHGVLQSTRGVEGGYSLSRPIEEITLLHILEATDGPLVPSIPPLDSLPYDSKQLLESLLSEVTADICRSLSEVSMADLLSARVNRPAYPTGS